MIQQYMYPDSYQLVQFCYKSTYNSTCILSYLYPWSCLTYMMHAIQFHHIKLLQNESTVYHINSNSNTSKHMVSKRNKYITPTLRVERVINAPYKTNTRYISITFISTNYNPTLVPQLVCVTQTHVTFNYIRFFKSTLIFGHLLFSQTHSTINTSFSLHLYIPITSSTYHIYHITLSISISLMLLNGCISVHRQFSFSN
jgi:hypothetical protein